MVCYNEPAQKDEQTRIHKMSDVTQNMKPSEKSIFESYKNTFPFPVVNFINDLDIRVFAEKMADNQSGAICKDDKGFVIRVNESHGVPRIRFTLAHELGHYFNDKEYLEKNGALEDYSQQSERKWLFREKRHPHDPEERKREVRANQFAAELLMPRDKFIEIWHRKRTPEEVADFFNVSVAAAGTRAASVLGEII